MPRTRVLIAKAHQLSRLKIVMYSCTNVEDFDVLIPQIQTLVEKKLAPWPMAEPNSLDTRLAITVWQCWSGLDLQLNINLILMRNVQLSFVSSANVA